MIRMIKNLDMESDILQTINIGVQDVPTKSSNLGFILASITGGIGVAISVICIPFVSPGFRRICLPYVPATTEQVKNILQVLRGKSGRLIDIGSGDGRIVIAAAKAGLQADGVELNPWLVGFSRIAAITQGVSSKTSFFRKDLWKFNLNQYNNVVIFGVEEMMHELKEKFKSELEPNCSIIVCRFPIPNSKPVLTVGEGIDTVWVYKTPLKEE